MDHDNDYRAFEEDLGRLAFALYSLGVFGSVGLFIDGDHIVAVLSRGLPLNPATILLFGARIWHWPSVYISGGLFIAALTLYLGLLCTAHAILDMGPMDSAQST